MTQLNKGPKQGDDEPTREQLRNELLQKMADLGGIEYLSFMVGQGYRLIDAPVVRDLIDALGYVLVTCLGVLYNYDDERGLYVAAADDLRHLLAKIGASLREERRRIDLDLGQLPNSYENALQSLMPRFKVDSRLLEDQFEYLKLLYRRSDLEMDGDPMTVNMQNGLLDLRTMTLTEHTYLHLSSIQRPYPFDPAAACPQWLQFLEQSLPDPEVRVFLQEFFGYVLLPTTKFEIVLILVGPGGTGKGTICKVAQKLVGEANCSDIALDKLGHRFQTAELQGKLLNVCPEVDASRTIDESMFKSLVSGDRRMVERKYKDPEPLTSYARFILPANGLPNIKDPTNAFFDRLAIITCDQQVRRQISTDDPGEGVRQADPDLLSKLEAELPGIFNWAVEGLRRLQSRGGFAPPAAVLQSARAYRNDQNQTYRFIDQFPDKGEGLWISSADLYREYQQWCESEGIKKPHDKNVFGKRVAQLAYPGVEKKDGSGKVRGFSGLGVPLQRRAVKAVPSTRKLDVTDRIFGDED